MKCSILKLRNNKTRKRITGSWDCNPMDWETIKISYKYFDAMVKQYNELCKSAPQSHFRLVVSFPKQKKATRVRPKGKNS